MAHGSADARKSGREKARKQESEKARKRSTTFASGASRGHCTPLAERPRRSRRCPRRRSSPVIYRCGAADSGGQAARSPRRGDPHERGPRRGDRGTSAAVISVTAASHHPPGASVGEMGNQTQLDGSRYPRECRLLVHYGASCRADCSPPGPPGLAPGGPIASGVTSANDFADRPLERAGRGLRSGSPARDGATDVVATDPAARAHRRQHERRARSGGGLRRAGPRRHSSCGAGSSPRAICRSRRPRGSNVGSVVPANPASSRSSRASRRRSMRTGSPPSNHDDPGLPLVRVNSPFDTDNNNTMSASWAKICRSVRGGVPRPLRRSLMCSYTSRQGVLGRTDPPTVTPRHRAAVTASYGRGPTAGIGPSVPSSPRAPTQTWRRWPQIGGNNTVASVAWGAMTGERATGVRLLGRCPA